MRSFLLLLTILSAHLPALAQSQEISEIQWGEVFEEKTFINPIGETNGNWLAKTGFGKKTKLFKVDIDGNIAEEIKVPNKGVLKFFLFGENIMATTSKRDKKTKQYTTTLFSVDESGNLNSIFAATHPYFRQITFHISTDQNSLMVVNRSGNLEVITFNNNLNERHNVKTSLKVDDLLIVSSFLQNSGRFVALGLKQDSMVHEYKLFTLDSNSGDSKMEVLDIGININKAKLKKTQQDEIFLYGVYGATNNRDSVIGHFFRPFESKETSILEWDANFLKQRWQKDSKNKIQKKALESDSDYYKYCLLDIIFKEDNTICLVIDQFFKYNFRSIEVDMSLPVGSAGRVSGKSYLMIEHGISLL